jgi:hypothetical protein
MRLAGPAGTTVVVAGGTVVVAGGTVVVAAAPVVLAALRWVKATGTAAGEDDWSGEPFDELHATAAPARQAAAIARRAERRRPARAVTLFIGVAGPPERARARAMVRRQQRATP